jgi:peptidoglycan DL-endopeptidase CwlO
MFGIGFALAVVGVWLIDSAVQGRHPITVLKEIIEKPASARVTLSDTKGDVSPIKDVSNSINLWNQSTTETNNAGLDIQPAMSIGAGGGVSPQAFVAAASAAAPNSAAAQAVSYAKSQVGKPYRYATAGPNTFDCSGLMYAAWRSAGVTIPRTTAGMLASKNMMRVSKAELEPGDIVFPYVGHCFMYIGNNRVVEAPHTGTKVHITTMYAFMTARRPK